MGDFNFLDETDNIKTDRAIESQSDHISMYFNMRQNLARNSLRLSDRSSTISLLSLNRASFSDETHNGVDKNKISYDDMVFKKPKTPTKLNGNTNHSHDSKKSLEILKAQLSKADEVIQRFCASEKNKHGDDLNIKTSNVTSNPNIFSTCSSPQTPRPFLDDLSSILTEISRSDHQEGSLTEFPVREKGDILDLLKKDEKKFVANTSGFSHNSDITHFSGATSDIRSSTSQNCDRDQLSIGEYFGIRSDRITSLVDEKDDVSGFEEDEHGSKTLEAVYKKPCENKTLNTIQKLLCDEKLSGSALCDALLQQYSMPDNKSSQINNVTHIPGQLDKLSESRQSTPVASRLRLPQHMTPVRKNPNWQPARLQLSASTPISHMTCNDGVDDNTWQKLRETQNESNSDSTLQLNDQGDGGGDGMDAAIATGNLTIVSHRIGAITLNNSAALSMHSPLLDMINKLAELPDGTVDCSALTPLLRKQFPQLVEEEEHKTYNGNTTLNSASVKQQLSSDPGGWISYSRDPQTITACVQTKKMVSLPMASKDKWLMVRISGVELLMTGLNVVADYLDEAWVAGDVLTLRAKSVVFPPNMEHNFQFTVVTQKPVNAALRLNLIATDMNVSQDQKVVITVFLSAVLPPHGFTLSPASSTNFGTLPESCFESRSFKLTYTGDCDVPVLIFVQQENTSGNPFSLCNEILLNGNPINHNLMKGERLEFTLPGGAKQSFEFNVRFHPNVPTGLEEKRIIHFYGEVRVELQTITSGLVTVARTKLEGAVAYAKFLCRTECSPLIFNVESSEAPMTKPFFIKNVGAIPLKIALKVKVSPDDSTSEEDKSLFTVPSFLALPLEDCVSFPIVFSPAIGINYYRRFLVMTLEPNGMTNFDVELIGTVPVVERPLPSSRSSIKSGSTALSAACNDVAVKLTASNSALSWVATPLQKCVLRSFQVKIKSERSASARISINPDSRAFKILNEKSEALIKIRKSLKPDTAVTINVQFQPDFVGLHHSTLSFSFSGSSDPSLVQLTGFGGAPKMKIEDTHLDLHGNRMVKLIHPRADNFVFSAQFRVTNYGNASGFIFISPTANVLSIAHSLKVYPLRAVVEPNSNVIINVSQHLTRGEFSEVLAGQDIRKIATLNLLMGDEPSRQRLRKHISHELETCSAHLKNLVGEFPDEKVFNLDGIKESKNFQSLFMSSLQSSELVVVLEKNYSSNDETIADVNDTSCTFASLSDTILLRPTSAMHNKSAKSSCVLPHSEESSDKKVQEWLRKVE